VSEIKINRIKRNNAHLFSVLESALATDDLELRSKDIREKMRGVRTRQEMVQSMDKLTKYTRAGSFDPTRQFQLVANNVDPSVWRVILDTFARIDPETGQPMDDGLLYVTDADGKIALNKSFFYALLAGPLKKWDTRGKIVV
jgi:hypothetical protein